MENQPVSNVVWVKRSDLRANDYNPNHVATTELDLLALSIKSDGWTQPIVVRSDGEIIDGYHRWLVSERLEIYELTDGYVPVVYVDKPMADQIASTIRHNRARGGTFGIRAKRSHFRSKLISKRICAGLFKYTFSDVF